MKKGNINQPISPDPQTPELALHESEERFRTLVKNIPGAVYRCDNDSDWTMRFLSDGIEDICGYSASDFLGNSIRSYASVIYTDDRQLVDQRVKDGVARKEPYVVTYRVMHADGTIRWVHEKGQGVFGKNGNLTSLDGVIIDITERRSAEAALRESQEKYKSIVDNSTDAILLTCPDGKIVYASPASKEVLGYEPEELLGYTKWITHPDERERVRPTHRSALSGESGSHFEYRICTKDGNSKWVSHSWSPIYDDNKFTMLVSVIRDITEHKQVEETLRRAHDDMQKAFELQRQFLNNVTHEVRTPLTAIQGYAQMILEGLAGPVPEEQASLLRKILSCCKSLLEIVSGVLDIARIKSGIFGGHYTFCNVQDVAKRAIAAVTPQASQKGLSICVDKLSKDLSGLYDQEKIFVILSNLLSNSVKFTDHGEIGVILSRDEEITEIIVTDCGIGISGNDLDGIFDEFKQLDFPGKHKPSGFGIGLAIVAAMVHSMGGSLTVSSERGVGTAFTLHIPTPDIDQPTEL